MKKFLQLLGTVALIAALVGCSTDKAAAVTVDGVKYVPAGDAAKKPAPATPAAQPAPIVTPAPKPVVSIPAGTRLSVSLMDTLSSDKSSAGDGFMASLLAPLVIDGKTLLAQGTKFRGRVVSAEGAGRIKGLAQLQLELTEISHDRSSGTLITTNTFTDTAENTKKRDVGVTAGGAGIGAAIGAIAGGKKGAGIGAAIGGGAGAGEVLATKGKELHYPPETRLSFTLAHAVQL